MNILKWFMLTVGFFIIFVVIIFAVMKYMYPPEVKREAPHKEKIAEFEKKVIGLEGYEKRNKLIDSLQTELKSARENMVSQSKLIDSLNTVIAGFDQILQRKDAQLEKFAFRRQSAEKREEKAKKIAKTFESMKPKEMSAILKNIDDNTVMAIYRNMNNRFKKNLLLALSSKRAAKLAENYIESVEN